MRRIGLMVLLVSAVLLGSGCVVEPPSELQLQYSMNALAYDNGLNNLEVSYWVKNSGDYDLEDIQLYIMIDRDEDGTFDVGGWTNTFDLSSGSTTTRTFYYTSLIIPSNVPDTDIDERVIVTRVGMDNPPDED